MYYIHIFLIFLFFKFCFLLSLPFLYIFCTDLDPISLSIPPLHTRLHPTVALSLEQSLQPSLQPPHALSLSFPKSDEFSPRGLPGSLSVGGTIMPGSGINNPGTAPNRRPKAAWGQGKKYCYFYCYFSLIFIIIIIFIGVIFV